MDRRKPIRNVRQGPDGARMFSRMKMPANDDA